MLACYSSDNAAPIPKLNQNETKALNLAIELIEKLSANTPFSRQEGKSSLEIPEIFMGTRYLFTA